MIMIATVIRTFAQNLLVRDAETGNEVQVNFGNARAFSPGDLIRITFNGIMTQSLPPQITATAIQRLPSMPGTPTQPSQTTIRRATVLQIRRDSLLVRDASNGRQIIVHFAHSHHFCVGQRVTIHYDTITLSNPMEISATDIVPIC